MEWEYVMKGIGESEKRGGKPALCPGRGGITFIASVNRSYTHRDAGTSREPCWFRGVFEMNKVILKHDS